MSRFIEVNSTLINTDHITHVAVHDDCTLSIFLDSGTIIDTDSDYTSVINCIMGRDHVVAVAPCSDVVAIMAHDGKEVLLPVHHLAVTAAGEVRALDVSFECIDFFDTQESFRGILCRPTDGEKAQNI